MDAHNCPKIFQKMRYELIGSIEINDGFGSTQITEE